MSFICSGQTLKKSMNKIIKFHITVLIMIDFFIWCCKWLISEHSTGILHFIFKITFFHKIYLWSLSDDTDTNNLVIVVEFQYLQCWNTSAGEICNFFFVIVWTNLLSCKKLLNDSLSRIIFCGNFKFFVRKVFRASASTEKMSVASKLALTYLATGLSLSKFCKH